jgi:hypothetical protein
MGHQEAEKLQRRIDELQKQSGFAKEVAVFQNKANNFTYEDPYGLYSKKSKVFTYGGV